MSKRSTVVHCWASKLELLIEEHEAVNGVGSFVGSALWRATLAPGWRDGVCKLANEHIGDHLFDDDICKSEKRKAS